MLVQLLYHNHLCQFWSLPSEVEYVLFLAKVLDNNLETVWPGAHEKQDDRI